jgi:hypothetical protein
MGFKVGDVVLILEPAFRSGEVGTIVEADRNSGEVGRCDCEIKFGEKDYGLYDYSELKLWEPGTPTPEQTPSHFAHKQISGNGVQMENMTKAQYAKFVEGTFSEMLALIKRKNADYTGSGDDPFANFRRATQVGVHPISGLAVRFLDKVARIESFLQAGKLENESFEDAWLDVIGYACLALGMLKERNDKLGEGKW